MVSIMCNQFFSTPFVNQDELNGRMVAIWFCLPQACLYTFVTFSFVSFFITTSLQFGAFRIYMKGLVGDLNAMIVDGNGTREIPKMLCEVVRFHVAAKE